MKTPTGSVSILMLNTVIRLFLACELNLLAIRPSVYYKLCNKLLLNLRLRSLLGRIPHDFVGYFTV